MPSVAKSDLFKLIAWFLPLACRGLALGFAILAVAVLLGMGDEPAPDRYFTAGLYGAIAVASFAFGAAVTPILRRRSNSD